MVKVGTSNPDRTISLEGCRAKVKKKIMGKLQDRPPGSYVWGREDISPCCYRESNICYHSADWALSVGISLGALRHSVGVR